jgi:hypothetical protein
VIVHVVLFTPTAALRNADRAAILDALASSIRAIPSVRGCRVGRRVRHGLPGYEQAMASSYDYLLLLEFEDVSGLREYLRHAAHASLGSLFSASAQALAYDFEMADLEGARELL